MVAFKVQMWAYAYIRQFIHGPVFIPSIRRRFVDNLCVDISDLPTFETSSLVCKLSSHCAMCVLKTWLNAWTTSKRMHEKGEADVAIRHWCVFGHECLEDLRHYAQCSAFRVVATNAHGMQVDGGLGYGRSSPPPTTHSCRGRPSPSLPLGISFYIAI